MKISLCMPIVLIFHAVIENSSQVKLREQKLACLDLLPLENPDFAETNWEQETLC